MTEPDIEKLVDLLLKGTREGNVSWIPAMDVFEHNMQEEDDFIVSMPEYSVNISRLRGAGVSLALLGAQGQVLYRNTVEQGQPAHGKYEELFEAARRKAARVDDIIADLTNALERGEVLGR